MTLISTTHDGDIRLCYCNYLSTIFLASSSVLYYILLLSNSILIVWWAFNSSDKNFMIN